ncbi:MAG: hypothetical protein AB7T06_17945 [Kofleriaceae bacterium]
MKIAVAAALMSTACSLLIVRGPPSPLPPVGSIECTGDRVVPTVDLVAAAAESVVGVALARETDELMIGVSTLLIVALSTTSAIVGYREAGKCRAALATMARNARERDHETDEQRANKDTAWIHTMEAMERAQAGDCGRVRDLDTEVLALDPGFHQKVFVVDAAIARCLAR